MLAGLLFATHEAVDRPDRLAATLPFAGSTVIEHQARLLLAAGAAQIVVVVSRLTPDLLGALGRIGRRGVAVDAVRNAAEAAEKLHPLSRVLLLADGLVTTETVVRRLAAEGADTLLVVGEDEAAPAFERIGGRLAWAGAARLAAARLAEVAALPRDYDLQSALLRAASQAGAAHLLLPDGAVAEGHGIEHRAAALDARGRVVLASAMSGARGWFDRWIVAPVARLALPALVDRRMPTIGVVVVAGLLYIAGFVAVHFALLVTALFLALAAHIGWKLAGALGRLRDEFLVVRAERTAVSELPAFFILPFGIKLMSGLVFNPVPLQTAITLVVLGFLGERAIAGRERALGWGSPGAYLFVVFVATLLGEPVAGLIAAAIYAAITAGFAIEALRRQA